MNKCIRIDCYQTSANYKKPMSVEIGESYRLPPYSTVLGLVHNVCGFKEYHPMQVSIQGEYVTVISDMYYRNLMGISYEPDRHHYKVPNSKGGYDGVTRGLGYNELIIGVNLVLHIKPEEKDFETVLNGLNNPAIYPSLGRYEDLLRIDKVCIVELEPAEEINLQYNAYIPESILQDSVLANNCTRFTLNKVYKIDRKRNCRIWEKVKAYHYVKGSNVLLESPTGLVEKRTKLGVFFA